jgi:predicted dithiol-disulfide oxidoreductase (DUF899 family)
MLLYPAPSIVDLELWRTERDRLIVRGKAHTPEADAIAAMRRLPITRDDSSITLVGADGPISLLDVFEGRDQLIVYKHMYFAGEPMSDQCEGCRLAVCNMLVAPYTNAQGITFAGFGNGPYEELETFRQFMGYTVSWFSNHGIDDPAEDGGRSLASFLRWEDRTYLTYATRGRGLEAIIPSLNLLDMSPYGRREVWQDSPIGWPQEPTYSFWRTDARGDHLDRETGRPVPQGTRPEIPSEEPKA